MAMSDKIKIFAIDHRHNVEWKLPFIRLGTGFNSDASLKDSIGENILQYDMMLSEGTAMWWVAHNQLIFEKCDYIGFCTYRRFLSIAKPNFGPFPICNVPVNQVDQAIPLILSPEKQYDLLYHNKLDMILPKRFPDYMFQGDSTCVQEVMYRSSIRFDMNLGIPREVCYKAFDILLNHTPNSDKEYMAKTFQILNTYHFNIFTLSRQLFDRYNAILWPTIFECLDYVDSLNLSGLHPRWMGYLVERFTSCIILMFQFQGFKSIDAPVMLFE